MFEASTILTQLQLLPSSSEAMFVTGFLTFISNKIRTQYGLEFGVVSPELRPVQSFDTETHIVPINFVRDITEVRIKQYGTDKNELLVENTDFYLRKHRLGSNVAFELRLLKKGICLPDYIQINGKWSFAEAVSEDITQAVLETLKIALGNYKYNSELADRGGKSINRTKIGDVEVTFGSGNSSRDTIYDSIFASSSLKLVLDTYLC